MSQHRLAPRLLALLGVLGGGSLIVLTVFAGYWALRGDPVPRRWSGGALYLATSAPEEQSCRISPPGGPAYRVVVPRTVEGWLDGVRVEGRPGSTTTLGCTDRVTATSGAVLLLYPLAENEPWVLLPAIATAVVGAVYGRPSRRPPAGDQR